MAVVMRPRWWVLVLVLIAAAGFGLLPLVYDDGDDQVWADVMLVVIGLAYLAAAVRTRVVVRPDRVRLVSTLRSIELLRHEVIAVHGSGGRRRPAFVALEGERAAPIPELIGPRQLAAGLGVPLLRWNGDEIVPRPPGPPELGTPWVGVAAVVLVGTAIAIPIWYYATV